MLRAISICVLIAFPALTRADDLDCAALREGFGQVGDANQTLGDWPVIGTPELCDTVREPGNLIAGYCRWSFAYRSDAYKAAVLRLRRAGESCFGLPRQLGQPGVVNHPDTSILDIWTVDGHEVSIAFKDKARLGRSFIFIRSVSAGR